MHKFDKKIVDLICKHGFVTYKLFNFRCMKMKKKNFKSCKFYKITYMSYRIRKETNTLNTLHAKIK